MATRSLTFTQLENGSILRTYTHWDGYPDHVGGVLATMYGDSDDAIALALRGNRSNLDYDESEIRFKDEDSDVITFEEFDEYLNDGDRRLAGEEFIYWKPFDEEWKFASVGYVYSYETGLCSKSVSEFKSLVDYLAE